MVTKGVVVLPGMGSGADVLMPYCGWFKCVKISEYKWMEERAPGEVELEVEAFEEHWMYLADSTPL